MPDVPKAILFDLGDTVLREVAYDINSGFEAVSSCFQHHVTIETLEQATERFQSETREFMLLRWIEANLNNDNSKNADEVELKLWKNTVSLTPIADVQIALKFLVANGVRIAAVSNAIFSSTCMNYELEQHGLSDYFEFILSSADLGIRKPEVRIFQSALEALELKPSEVWFIGDKWEADIVGASSTQMTPVWFNNRKTKRDSSLMHLELREWSGLYDLWAEQHA